MAVNRGKLIGRIRVAQGKDLLRRGLKVQARARLLISGAGAGHPKRVATGQTRSSIQVQLRRATGGSPLVRVGSGLKKALWIHEGTGIYGPRRQLIRPTRASVLVFPSAKYGAKKGKFRGMVAVRYVRGMRPNKFLKDALPAARD